MKLHLNKTFCIRQQRAIVFPSKKKDQMHSQHPRKSSASLISIGEELLLLECIDIFEEMLGKEAAGKNSKVPLSENTVQRCIDEMSSDIC